LLMPSARRGGGAKTMSKDACSLCGVQRIDVSNSGATGVSYSE
jgi:hypothetical protein